MSADLEIPAPPITAMRVLCLGDVVAKYGRQALAQRLPAMRRRFSVDLVIANGENASGGTGLAPDAYADMVAAGVDVVTSGNHIWKHKEVYHLLNSEKAVLRPLNFGSKVPGKGLCIVELGDGSKIGIFNLAGRTFMTPCECPFLAAEKAVAILAEAGATIRILDFHAEASSEKRAMAHYLDGKISAVFGTHTHVQTNDGRVSCAGTASLTDLGMCGVEENSVLGMDTAAVLKRFCTGLPAPYKPGKGKISLNGAFVDIDKETGKALSIFPYRDKPS